MLAAWKEVLVTTDIVGSLFQCEASALLAYGAGGENLALQQGRVMGLAVPIVLDPIHPRNRNRLRWLINLLSHTRSLRGTTEILARLRPAVLKFEGSY